MLARFKFDLKQGTVRPVPDDSRKYDLREVFEGEGVEDVTPVLRNGLQDEAWANGATAATARAVSIATPRGVPVELRVQALAGYRSFDTMQTRRATLGWALTNGGNVLGVGMTGTYGIRVTKGWRFTPFVSLDYNRVDSARIVDAASPRPYILDNADTGMTGSVGATLSHRFGAERRFRAIAFGALIASTSDGAPPREFGSLGARFVHAIGESGVKAAWQETGLGVDYRLNARMRVNGAVVQTLDRVDGDTTAAKLGLRVAL